MHSDLIDGTRMEILRLIGQQNNLIINLLEIPDLLKESSDDGQIRTDINKVKNWQSILNNEAKKVDQLEMVLTILGTMKAGKSTTINAIVGHEVLPNRNYPMTTLPTLIRHRKGQTIPVLNFSNSEPIEKMVEKVREKLVILQKRNSLEQIDLYKNVGKELVDNIIKQEFGQFKEKYEGQEEIFDFLKSLNDLMRLSIDSNIDIELPLEEYKSIDDFPSIEVEFFHLTNLNELTKGSLALLDTPGPNDEVLGEKLRKVFNTQIERASGILAILDYTQLGGEAGAEIRRQLTIKAADAIENRSFFLVNKFDQKENRGMKASEVKRHVAEVEMNGKITQEKVYPVSAKYGYLSNRALYEIHTHGCLPENELDGWVEDFGKLAMGELFDPEDIDLDEAKLAADKLWKASRFDKPIQEVVINAANTAAFVSMQSATAKMIEYGQKMEDFLEIQKGSLTKSIEALRQSIGDLAKDIYEVGKAESKAEKELNDLMASSLDAVALQYKKTEKTLKLALESYFQEGKKLEVDRLIEKSEMLENEYREQIRQLRLQYNQDFSDPFSDFFRYYFMGGNREQQQKIKKLRKIQQIHREAQESLDFDPKNPKIQFDSNQIASFFLRQINQKISSIVNESSQEFELTLHNLSKGLEETIPQIINEGVGNILENAKNRLLDDGFSLNFEAPKPDIFGSNQIDMNEILLSTIEEKTRTTETRKRRKRKGWFSATKRWFGEQFYNYDWGYEDYWITNEEQIFVVDMKKIENNVLNSLDSNVENLNQYSRVYFDNTLQPLVENYFNRLKDYLEEFRGNLQDGIEKQKLTEDAKQNLINNITELYDQTKLHSDEVFNIKKNLSNDLDIN